MPAWSERSLWVAVRAALREMVESTTVAGLVTEEFPGHVRRSIATEDAWHRR